MPSSALTPVQSTLLHAMSQAIASERYQRYFQGTFAQESTPVILFFHHNGKDDITVHAALIDFLALVQHGDIALTHQEPTAYWGYLLRPHAPA